MKAQELICYILEGKQVKSEMKKLRHLLETSQRFFDFVHRYQYKIRSKFREAATNEDLGDILSELEIAYLFLLSDCYVVEYEKGMGTGNQRSPDFTIQCARSFEFNVEVKRIREPSLCLRYNAVIRTIVEQVRKTPSSLGFSIGVSSIEPSEGIVERLEKSTEDIIMYIRSLIAREEATLPNDKPIRYSVPGFEEDKMEVMLLKPSVKKDFTKTSYYGGIHPISYTNKEYRKFGDTICDKIGQCIPGMINVLAITIDSSAHEPEDILESIAWIKTMIRGKNDTFFKKKEFAGTDDFLNRSKNLSGIVFKTTWIPINIEKNYNMVWCNENADCQIPEELREYLKYMGRTP